MDIVLALLAFPFALAVVLPLVLIIRLESGGSVFFRQSRVGRYETVFTLVKLRTMHESTPDIPSHEAVGAMITPLGRILRKLKLDELPQIWNVLIGEMSFVGPRPCLETQQELIDARRALGVFSVRPGITGLAQVAGVDMSTPQKLAELDHNYIVTKSIVNDGRIILATLFGRGSGDAIS